MIGQKHLIKCRCVLLQYKKMQNPPSHQFTVFSVINDSDKVNISYAQCPNCGVIHKITEIGKSEILQNKEAMSSLITIDDIKLSLPENLKNILEKNSADLPTWEAAQFIHENKQWGNFVVLTSETEGNTKQIKYLRILGESLYKIENHTKEEIIK